MRVVGFILIFSLVMPITLKFGVMVKYQVQYNHYVNVLCENKEDPTLKCNGKCALMKELKSIESNSTSSEEPATPAPTHLEVFIVNITSFIINEQTYSNPKVNVFYCNNYSLLVNNKIDYPPKYF